MKDLTKQEYKTLVEDLYKKVDSLETKLDYIIHIMKSEKACDKKTKPEYVPTINMQEWIQTFIIQREHLSVIFETSILDGWKDCIDFNWGREVESMNHDELPIWATNTRVKQIYIFDDDEWRQITTEDIHGIIEIIWRKMLKLYFMGDKMEESDEQRDVNKKKLIDMRKKLIDKHSKAIEKMLLNKCKN